MKNYFYLLCFLLLTALTSFAIVKNPSPKKNHKNKIEKVCGICTKPNTLGASKNYNVITFTWSGTGSNPSNVGSYYNYDSAGPRVRNFSLPNAYTGAQLYQVNPNATSVQFGVTHICGDGTFTPSDSKFVTF